MKVLGYRWEALARGRLLSLQISIVREELEVMLFLYAAQQKSWILLKRFYLYYQSNSRKEMVIVCKHRCKRISWEKNVDTLMKIIWSFEIRGLKPSALHSVYNEESVLPQLFKRLDEFTKNTQLSIRISLRNDGSIDKSFNHGEQSKKITPVLYKSIAKETSVGNCCGWNWPRKKWRSGDYWCRFTRPARMSKSHFALGKWLRYWRL